MSSEHNNYEEYIDISIQFHIVQLILTLRDRRKRQKKNKIHTSGEDDDKTEEKYLKKNKRKELNL